MHRNYAQLLVQAGLFFLAHNKQPFVIERSVKADSPGQVQGSSTVGYGGTEIVDEK